MNQSMTIANTILKQLGGSRFLAMTGANKLLATGDGLQFSLPRYMARSSIRLVVVTLTPADLYKIEFMKWAGSTKPPVTVQAFDGVYAEQLRHIFEEATGLATSL